MTQCAFEPAPHKHSVEHAPYQPSLPVHWPLAVVQCLSNFARPTAGIHMSSTAQHIRNRIVSGSGMSYGCTHTAARRSHDIRGTSANVAVLLKPSAGPALHSTCSSRPRERKPCIGGRL